jgi:mRNA interferase MazF
MIPYRKWDIILVPFPFTDLTTVKNRPALVVSPDSYNKSGSDVVVVFITSRLDLSSRPGDHRIRFWKQSGLPKPSLLRMKFATIDQAIISKKLGRLFEKEHSAVRAAFRGFFL